MLRNVHEALVRFEGEDDLELVVSEMDVRELRELRGCLTEQRALMLIVFTAFSVQEILPANNWSSGKDSGLHGFAREPGSMAKLNFLGE